MRAIHYFALSTLAAASIPFAALANTYSGILHIFSGPESFETCALLADHRASCWGDTPGAAPLQQIGKDLHSMALGFDFRCALTHDKQVWCWGNNDLGQAGNGSTVSKDDPTRVLLADGSVFDRVTAISAGAAHACALRDTSAWCWGWNTQRQIGNHNFLSPSVLYATPVVVEDVGDPPLTNLIRITAGGLHSCALLADNTGACWGYSLYGQLGNAKIYSTDEPGGSFHFHSPQTVYVDSGGLQKLVMGGQAIAGGDSWTCSLVSDKVVNSVACWGYNGDGELGTTDNRNALTAVPAYDERGKIVDAIDVTTGAFATCALMVDTTVRCWGSDSTGEMGSAAAGLNQNRGIQIIAADGSAFKGVVEIVAGHSHMCARTLKDDVYCWGDNSRGQLNLPSDGAHTVPLRIKIDAPIFTDNLEGPDYDSGF